MELFTQSARRVQAGFELKAADRPAVAHICRLVEGMPLAIELAGAWVRVLSCPEIAHKIELRPVGPKTSISILKRHKFGQIE